MRNTRKFLSVLLSLGMLFSIMSSIASAATNFSDVPSSHKYYSAITNLAVDGIIEGFEDGTYKPEDGVTRAQFATIICRAQNLTNLGNMETDFTDVNKEHWASGYIKMAAGMGIINGMGDGTFLPESPVLYEQAVKMVVSALNYGKAAEAKGGYPNGFMNVAADIGILKNITDGVMGTGSNRGTIAKLVDNMLDADTLGQDGSKGDSIRDGVLKSTSISGQVVSIYGSTIYADETSPCGRNQIQIVSGSKSYIFSLENLSDVAESASDYLGKSVTVYYKEDPDLKYQEPSSLTLQANKNVVKTVDITDVQEYTNEKVEYIEDYDSGDIEEVSVLSDANILYNGVATNDKLESLIDTSLSGEITFIDSDNSGEANVVFIKIYKTMIVKSITSDQYKLYDESSSSSDSTLTLDTSDRTMNITIKKNGKASTFSNIKVGDVVSYAKSNDGKTIDVLVSNQIVTGSVSKMTSLNDRVTIRVSGVDKEYKISDYFNTNFANKLEVGMTGKFYIDAFGKLAKVDTTSEASYLYGYLMDFDNLGTLAVPDLNVYLINITGSSSVKPVAIPLADKVKINSTTYRSESDFDDISIALEDSAKKLYSDLADDSDRPDKDAVKYSQVIKYTTNTQGKIDKIYTSLCEDEDVIKVDSEYYEKGITCTSTALRLDGKYTISSSTKVLFVPKDRYVHSESTDKFVGSTGAYFKAGSTKYLVHMLDINKTMFVPVIIVYGSSSAGSAAWATYSPVVVTGKGTELLNGETKNYISTITSAGQVAKYYEDDDVSVVDSVSIGDIIRIDLSSENLINEIKFVTNISKINDGTASPGATGEGDNSAQQYAQYRVVLGTAKTISSTALVTSKSFVDEEGNLLTDGNALETATVSDATKVIVINSSKIEAGDSKAISVQSLGEVVAYDDQKDNASKILIYSASSVVAKTIFIFK